MARFVATQGPKLALFFLPPHAPNPNPDECVRKDLKKPTAASASLALAEAVDDPRASAAAAEVSGLGTQHFPRVSYAMLARDGGYF